MRARRPSERLLRRGAALGGIAAALIIGGWLACSGSRGLNAPPKVRPRPAAAPAPDLPSTRAAATTRADAATLSEPELLALLRATVDPSPREALELAELHRVRFQDVHAEERALYQMQALVHLGEIVDARNLAGEFFAHYPQSPLGARVERLTGVHPRPPVGPTPAR